MALLFDRENRLLIYLRDDQPDIPYPNHWDLFGGHLEPGEQPEQALVREVKEELGIELPGWEFFQAYECVAGDAYPNKKYIYSAKLKQSVEDLTLHEGQRLAAITRERYIRSVLRIFSATSSKISSKAASGRRGGTEAAS